MRLQMRTEQSAICILVNGKCLLQGHLLIPTNLMYSRMTIETVEKVVCRCFVFCELLAEMPNWLCPLKI